MLEGLLGLLCCQLVGEVLTRSLHLRVPGPVVGMLLLLVLLAVAPPRATRRIPPAADRVLDALPLLFVPAGVGIITVLPLLRAQWLAVSVGLVVPWAVGLVVTAVTAALVAHATGRASDPTADDVTELVHDADLIEGTPREDA